MYTNTRCLGILAGMALILGPITQAQADCPGAAVQGGGYCLYSPDMSSLGGDIQGDTTQVLAVNTYPYRILSTASELDYWRQEALVDLSDGQSYRDSLLLIGVDPQGGTPLANLLKDPKQNYETAGLLDDFAARAGGLIQARDTFAYHLYLNYPDAETAKASLLDAVKTLGNLYLAVGDEFLVDALEWRFSADTLGLDEKLDEQIDLLSKAQGYYEQAVDSLVSGFSPAVGTNIYISDSFDDAVYSLFNLAVERLSLALREKSSKQLVRLMAPDISEQWNTAWSQAAQTLKSANISTYLATAAIAKKRGDAFDDAGADSNLVGALNALRKQGNIYNQRLNPLGYDNRYIPALNFENLYALATDNLNTANGAKTEFEGEKRLFDSNLEALQNQLNSLSSQYTTNLASYTGCSPLLDPDNPEQVQQFLICTGEAGGDLFDCRLDSGVDEFDTCVSNSRTQGSLAAKYRNLMDAQLRLNAARLHRDNILQRIQNENEKAGKLIEIKKSETNSHIALLDEYLPRLKAARTVTDTVTTASKREWKDDHWGKSERTRDHNTVESFSLLDEKLDIQTSQEKELLQLTTDFQIQQINLETAYAVKDLLLSEAEAELEIQLAAQQKNSAIADFDNALQEKENLWYSYQRALTQLDYYTSKTANLRVLQSQAAIDLSRTMNTAAHYTYLAAKALEYRYVKPLVDKPVAAGRLRMTDLFKAQTPTDIGDFLSKLNAVNTAECPWGTFNPQYQTISLAYHVLGLTDGYLDPDGDGFATPNKSVEQARREGVQAFISEHINSQGNLEFSFPISENSTFLANSILFNIKMWSGPAPSVCDPLPTPVIGTTVSLITTQNTSLRPKVRLRQTGHSSLKDGNGTFHEYIPVYDSHFLFEGSGDYIPSTGDEIVAFIGDAREGGQFGTWTGKFKGKSISSSDWSMEIFDWNSFYKKTDFSKITDILLHVDTIAQSQ